jgi:hypothetical protein
MSTNCGEPIDGEPNEQQEDKHRPIVAATPDNITGCPSLLYPEADDQQFRAQLMEEIESMNKLGNNQQHIKSLRVLDSSKRGETMTCSRTDGYQDVPWKCKRVSHHQELLKQMDKNCNRSMFIVMVEWENGEVTSVLLEVLAKNNPALHAMCCKVNQLSETLVEEEFECIAGRNKKHPCIVKQTKLRLFIQAPKCRHVVETPHNCVDAMRPDKPGDNTLWANIIELGIANCPVHNDEPDFSDIPICGFNRSRTNCRIVGEFPLQDALTSLCKCFPLLHYTGANSLHYMVTGHPTNGMLHCLSKTPNDWHTKKRVQSIWQPVAVKLLLCTLVLSQLL